MNVGYPFGMFAFWRHSGFPGVLGARVLQMDDEGRVQVEGFGVMWFKPIHLMPLVAGKKLKDKLDALEKKRNAAIRAVEKDFDLRLSGVVPWKAP